MRSAVKHLERRRPDAASIGLWRLTLEVLTEATPGSTGKTSMQGVSRPVDQQGVMETGARRRSFVRQASRPSEPTGPRGILKAGI